MNTKQIEDLIKRAGFKFVCEIAPGFGGDYYLEEFQLGITMYRVVPKYRVVPNYFFWRGSEGLNPAIGVTNLSFEEVLMLLDEERQELFLYNLDLFTK